MTKQQLIDLDDSLILSNPALITKQEHSEFNIALINEIDGTSFYEDITYVNKKLIVNTSVPAYYFVDISKAGGFRRISGHFNIANSNIYGNLNFLFEIDDLDGYEPLLSAINTYIISNTNYSGSNNFLRIFKQGTKIYLSALGTFYGNVNYYFDLTYKLKY